MSMKTLLLGPGFETWRLPMGSPAFGSDPAEHLTVVDYDPKVLDFWRERGALGIGLDLRLLYGNVAAGPLRATNDAFDEVHAYELLNLLAGDSADFFRLWRFIWDALRPAGKVWATVPHWESEWIHAYPAPQRTYTPGLLSYLNQDSKNPARERGFSSIWPPPYCFKIDNSWLLSDVNGKPVGWHFCLVKVEAPIPCASKP